MSARQLKKLRQQQELAKLEDRNSAAADESPDDEPELPRARASAFTAFAALDREEGDVDEDDVEEHEVDQPAAIPDSTSAPTSSAPKKNKKSKKKKKKATSADVVPSQSAAPAAGEPLDDIDKALQDLNVKQGGNAKDVTANIDYDAALAKLLSINSQHLKAVNEMRNLFGRETLDQVENDEEAGEGRGNRRRARQEPTNVDLETFLRGPPGNKIPEVMLRRNPFVQGKDTWPRASAGGLIMKTVTDEKKQPTEFRLVHDAPYEKLEMQFYHLVDMHDPMQLVYFLHRNPYHVSSLIQVSRIAKQDQNNALSADLCERALFTLGRVTLSSFRQKLEQGTARVDFTRPENRQFWLAGYHYIRSLVQKGTYRTALEWAKLFLSISPDDEYQMMNFVHVMAVRARRCKWFIQLCDTKYFQTDSEKLPMRLYHRQTIVLAKLLTGDVEGARAELVKGMETLPWLYCELCKALNIDAPRVIWAVQPRNDDDALYTELYIHTAKTLWNAPQAISLIKEAGEIANKIELSSLSPAHPVTLSVARYIYLDNTPSLMGLVPPAMLHVTPNFDYDPLPPPRDENKFSYSFQGYPWRKVSALHESAVNPIEEGLRQDLDRDLARALALHRAAAVPANMGVLGENELAAQMEGDEEGDFAFEMPGDFGDGDNFQEHDGTDTDTGDETDGHSGVNGQSALQRLVGALSFWRGGPAGGREESTGGGEGVPGEGDGEMHQHDDEHA